MPITHNEIIKIWQEEDKEEILEMSKCIKYFNKRLTSRLMNSPDSEITISLEGVLVVLKMELKRLAKEYDLKYKGE